MKVDTRSRTERIGVSNIQLIFVELGWIFREQPIDDYGIDAHVEIVQDEVATGKLIALQIKAGESFFKEIVNNHIVYRGELKHLIYWHSHSLPVIVVLFDLEEKIAYWQIVNHHTAQKLDRGWKLNIPLYWFSVNRTAS